MVFAVEEVVLMGMRVCNNYPAGPVSNNWDSVAGCNIVPDCCTSTRRVERSNCPFHCSVASDKWIHHQVVCTHKLVAFLQSPLRIRRSRHRCLQCHCWRQCLHNYYRPHRLRSECDGQQLLLAADGHYRRCRLQIQRGRN